MYTDTINPDAVIGLSLVRIQKFIGKAIVYAVVAFLGVIASMLEDFFEDPQGFVKVPAKLFFGLLVLTCTGLVVYGGFLGFAQGDWSWFAWTTGTIVVLFLIGGVVISYIDQDDEDEDEDYDRYDDGPYYD